MFPEVSANLDTLTLAAAETDKPPGADFVFDFTAGEHSLIGGKLKECSSEETVMQWVELVLRTEADKYAVYTEDEVMTFGLSVYKYIGSRKYPVGFIASELKRELTEQLAMNRFIAGMEDFTAVREGRSLHVGFTVVLTAGARLSKEWVIDGL